MQHLINKCNNIYDIMASCYHYIVKDKNFSLNEVSIDPNPFTKRLNDIFDCYLECSNDNIIMSFNTLKQELTSLIQRDSFNSSHCFYIIKHIDECIEYHYSESNILDSQFNSYKCLNYELRDDILIFPIVSDNFREKINCIYKKEYSNDYLRKLKDYDNNSINKFLDNYKILTKKDLDMYELKIHEFLGYEEFNSRIYKNNLIIALCPITNRNIHDIFNIEYTKYETFRIKNMDKDLEQYILNKCKKFISALTRDIDFLIFPEMLMNNRIIQGIQEAIRESNYNIYFTIFGSMWENEHNKSLVCYKGEDIFYYYKKIPFKLQYDKDELNLLIQDCHSKPQKKLLQKLYDSYDFSSGKISFTEHLKKIGEDNNKIHLIDIKGLGRFFTLICKDIDDDKYMNIMKMTYGDFILLPACTPSIDLISGAETLSDRNHCTTIMSNTCAALCKDCKDIKSKIKSNKNIGFITTPEKCANERSTQKVYYKFNSSCENCADFCKGRIFSINLSNYQNLNNKISLEINEID